MLKLARELDPDNAIYCLISGWAAYDPETKARLHRSNGRRMAGRPARYLFYDPIGGPHRFTAHSDEEAVEKAKKILAKQATTRANA
jgi:hypothetical protein